MLQAAQVLEVRPHEAALRMTGVKRSDTPLKPIQFKSQKFSHHSFCA